VGGLFFIISLIVLLFGAIHKSSKLKKIAFGIGVVPILCFGTIVFYYVIAIPSFNNSQMKGFSGTYLSYKSENELSTKNKLILLGDGTYKFEGMKGLTLEKNGTWKTGGIDGCFEFYDNNGRLINLASPIEGDGNEKIVFNLYDSNEVKFMKTKHQ
jgi:hypothetical protein